MADDRRSKPGEASQVTGRRAGVLLAVLVLVNLFNFMDRQLPFILAEAIKRDLGLSDTELGMLTGFAFLIIYSVASLPLARLADRWSPKLTLTIVLGLWSAMTALGGIARNFVELALTRTGVALGEAGSTPSAHAVIQRVFPADRRGLALGIFQMGTPAGGMLGMMLGGWMNDVIGWRTTMIVAGLLGFVVVILAAFAIPDVRLKAEKGVRGESYVEGVRALMGSSAFSWMFVAMCLVGATVYATMVFSTPFLMRLHGFSTTQAGLSLGILLGAFGMAGTIIGGMVFDSNMRGKRDRLLFWPALSFFLAAPTSLIAWFVHDPVLTLVLLSPISLAITFYFPAMFGSAHIIAGPTRHAMASSLLIIGSGLVGGLAGPVVVGMISDTLAPRFGPESLRYALIFVPVVASLAGAAFYMANRKLATELNLGRILDAEYNHSS